MKCPRFIAINTATSDPSATPLIIEVDMSRKSYAQLSDAYSSGAEDPGH